MRRLQRVAQLKQVKGKGGFLSKTLSGISSAPFMFGGGKKDPAKQLETAEGLLAKDPHNVAALRMMAEAAGGLGFLETVAFALDAVRELEPGNRANLIALGEAWLAAGKPAEALKVADEILVTKPMDADAQTLMRKASIAQTMTKGNWEGQGSFRDKLKDEAQAVMLEQAAKVVASGDMTQRLLDEALGLVAKEPTNLNHYRTIAQAYQKLGNLEETLAWVRKARQVPGGGADSALEKQETDLATTVIEKHLKAAEAALAAAPHDPAAKAKMDAARTDGRHTVRMGKCSEAPLGTWNRYRIVVDGTRIELYVNGELQNVATDVEHVGGRIALQSEGAYMQFRNIRIRPLLGKGNGRGFE